MQANMDSSGCVKCYCRMLYIIDMGIITTFLKLVALIGAFLFVVSVLNAIGAFAAPLFGLACLIWAINFIGNSRKK